MVTLNKIREMVSIQDEELEKIIKEYVKQNSTVNLKESFNNDFNNDLFIKNTKSKIEELISANKISEADKLLQEYKEKVKDDISIYSMEGIILLNKNDVNRAYDTFRSGIEIDSKNVDLLYNIAHTSLLLGNIEESINYYKKCLNITTDYKLIEEIKIILSKLENNKNYTFLTLGISENDELFERLNRYSNNIICINENNEIEYENKFKKGNISIYEASSENCKNMIDDIIENNNNCIFICNDIYKLSIFNKLKNKCKTIYYVKKNLYISSDNYLNHSTEIYIEKEICNNCDLIITGNIKVYLYKFIVEKRENIFFIEEEIEDEFFINIITNNNNSIKNINNKINFNYYIDTVKNEYTRKLYLLLKESKNIESSISIAKDIYEEYNTEEIYGIYLTLLSQNKKYKELCTLAINSEYCEDIYKAELTYLNKIRQYDLIDFIANISIKNYSNINRMTTNNINYKISIVNFEINKFDKAYKKYIELINENNTDIINSPIVNRNIAYLMYSRGEDRYKIFYSNYRSAMEFE